jgi:hypothetical protein
MATIKQLGERIRQDLAAARKAGTIPDRVGEYSRVQYDVRASAPKAGPKVTIKVSGVEHLIPGHPDLTPDAVREWKQGAGAELLAKVEAIRNRYNPDPPVYGGSTEFGPILLYASVATKAEVIGGTK